MGYRTNPSVKVFILKINLRKWMLSFYYFECIIHVLYLHVIFLKQSNLNVILYILVSDIMIYDAA